MVLPRERSQSRVSFTSSLGEARAFPAERLRPGDRTMQLAAPHVELRAVVLEDRRLGAGLVAGLHAVLRAFDGQVEAGLVDLELRDAVAHHGVGDAVVSLPRM